MDTRQLMELVRLTAHAWRLSLQVDVTSSHHTSATIDYTSIGEAAKVLLPRRRQVRLLPDRSAG